MSDITYLPGKEPHEKEHRLIFKNVDRKGWNPSIKTYLADGGYEMLKKAITMDPKAIIDEVKTRLPIWKKEHYADGETEWVNCQDIGEFNR